MKKLAYILLVAVTSAFAVSANALAHPLGNFTINRFSRIEVSGPRIYVVYVLDMAEIPTFQAGRIDPSFIITHEMPLEEAPNGYDMFVNKEDECVKVVLKP